MALPEPFGGFLVLGAIALTLIVGLCVVIAGRNSKKKVFKGIGIIVAPWILLAILAVVSPGIDEWNRSLDSPSEAWGTWEGDGYTIELNSDSTFKAQLRGETLKGTWEVDDWNVYLTTSTGEERYMRFVEDSGNLLLLPDPPRVEMVAPGPITRKR